MTRQLPITLNITSKLPSLYNINKLLNKFLSKRSTRVVYTEDWFGQDSKENFEKNLKTDFDALKYYLNNPIKYIWNSDKFRSKFEFVPNKKLDVDIYLGCSHTMGTAHSWEKTWPYHVSKFTNNAIVNLGVGGAGIEISFINLAKYINYFNVKGVFHFQPIYPRYVYSEENKFNNISIQHIDSNPNKLKLPWKDDYILNQMTADDYIVYHHFKHSMSIEGLCKQNDIPYFHLYKVPPIEITKETVEARDLLHYNTSQLESISNSFINQLKEFPLGYNEISYNFNKSYQYIV